MSYYPLNYFNYPSPPLSYFTNYALILVWIVNYNRRLILSVLGQTRTNLFLCASKWPHSTNLPLNQITSGTNRHSRHIEGVTQKQIRAGLTQSGQYQTSVAVDNPNKWYQSQIK